MTYPPDTIENSNISLFFYNFTYICERTEFTRTFNKYKQYIYKSNNACECYQKNFDQTRVRYLSNRTQVAREQNRNRTEFRQFADKSNIFINADIYIWIFVE